MSLGPGSGYGDAAEAYLHGLRSAGVSVTWTPLGWPSNRWDAPLGPVANVDLGSAAHRDIADRPIDHHAVVVCSPPFWHDQLAVETAGRLLVAYTTWETDRVPADWPAILNRYDRVLVPSEFNAAVFARSGVSAPITVIPHIARRDQPAGAGSRSPARSGFVFYMISTWTTRKAILDAVRAYVDAFTADDDVMLVIHTTATDRIAEARLTRRGAPAGSHACATWFTLAQALAGTDRLPRITLSTRWLAPAEVDELHARGDCFLSLSRGEGWGLGAFDAAAFGNPVIVTGWGGTLDFLPGGYPYCVDYELVPTLTEEPDSWWHPQPKERWARASIDHAAKLLRHVYDHRDEARSWGHVLQAHVQATFDAADITGRLIAALE